MKIDQPGSTILLNIMLLFGQPVTVWECDIFELFGCHSTIPVQLIKSRTVSCLYKLNEESVLLVVPCIDF